MTTEILNWKTKKEAVDSSSLCNQGWLTKKLTAVEADTVDISDIKH